MAEDIIDSMFNSLVKLVGWVFKKIFQLVWWLISSIFQFLWRLISKDKGGSDNSQSSDFDSNTVNK